MDQRSQADEPAVEPATTASAADAEGAVAGATRHTHELLAEHVPLTLLVDLLTPAGPSSEELLATEGLPDQAWWAGEDDPANA